MQQKNQKNKLTGLGDIIEKITYITGIQYIIKKFIKEDCGCERRRSKLNKIIHWKKKNKL